ncbi:Signal transduction histidine kinase CheA [hydrothermal vent metagenome]|uniref:histidine kinase n=1 Tax=hydrothermal vent metagenome TaxID=652676 RepID=A0A3B1B9A8_9ZZZZ
MTTNTDNEILQDFLVEAGEILECLSEELVDLEQDPENPDLLNSVFRSFHTIKGGAGFLGINALVNVCHQAEDVFNVLRQGNRSIDQGLMDAILQATDSVNIMFENVHAGVQPEEADPSLLEALRLFALPQEENAAEESPAEDAEPVVEVTQVQKEVAEAEIPVVGDDISEDEFEALLDQIHGEGKHGEVPVNAPAATEEAIAPAAANNSGAAGDGEISEDEFDALLDKLHGKGKHGGAPSNTEPPPQPATAQVVASAPESAKPTKPKKQSKPAKQAKAAKAKKNAASAKAGSKSSANKKALAGGTTVRVDTARLDDIMNMVGELVLVRNRLATLKAEVGEGAVAVAVSNLDVVTSDLQLAVMKTRMQPVKKVFGRFPRVVRDLARNLNKEIDLEMYGEETDLDKNLVEALADPLVHLVRNAVDHGIEMPDEREAAGKLRKGAIKLTASQEGDHIMLSISDDGKGMDPEVLRAKAVEKGIMDEDVAARMDNRECFNLIFHPGFSTKTEISDVSGRGVGMDVVKTRIAQMNGNVEINSELGVGSTIAIKLPLTLAILPTLMVVLGRQPFALPLSNVVEIFNMDDSRTNVVDGQLTIRVRDRALPLFNLHDWLVADPNAPRGEAGGHVVVVSSSGVHIGLVVDYLVGQEEVVIKPLGALLQGLEGMAGATITGDGKIALILDVPGLMSKYAH